MNKYQEAIDKLRSLLGKIAFLFGYKEDKHPIKTSEELNTLQELVDKSTPKKPIREIWGWDCPSCGKYVAYYPKKANGGDQNDVYVFLETCPNHDCRQAIDWSKDE